MEINKHYTHNLLFMVIVSYIIMKITVYLTRYV